MEEPSNNEVIIILTTISNFKLELVLEFCDNGTLVVRVDSSLFVSMCVHFISRQNQIRSQQKMNTLKARSHL
jgi:hypothetical protein